MRDGRKTLAAMIVVSRSSKTKAAPKTTTTTRQENNVCVEFPFGGDGGEGGCEGGALLVLCSPSPHSCPLVLCRGNSIVAAG